jgi:hypothetical protein
LRTEGIPPPKAGRVFVRDSKRAAYRPLTAAARKKLVGA